MHNTFTQAWWLTTDAAEVNEGSAVTFTIAHGAANTEYVYKVAGVQGADVAEGLIAIVTTDADGNATFTINAVADRATEGAETMTVSIVGQAATATVAVIDSSVNLAPEVTADQALTIAEGSAEGAAVGTVAATDADADAVTYAITSGDDNGFFAIDATSGAVTLTAAGAAAALDAETTASYTLGVTATDAKGLVGAEAAVTINVGDVNDNAPVAAAVTATTDEDMAVDIDVLASATDADVTAANNTLTIKADSVTVTGGNAVGTAAVVEGKIVFTPAANWNGTAMVNYVTTDGVNDSAASTATVTVAAVNDAPVATIPALELSSVVVNSTTTGLSAGVTVSDVENNFNGGSVTIDVAGYITKEGALGFVNGTNFTLAGSTIIATKAITGGTVDVVLGTFTTAGDADLNTVDAVAGDTNVAIGINQIKINITSDAITGAVVQQLLRDIKITTPVQAKVSDTLAAAAATVTVTVKDGADGVATFSKYIDATAALALTGFAETQEVQIAQATGYMLDAGTDVADFAANGAVTNGMTIAISSSVSGDAITFGSTLVANAARVLGNQLFVAGDGGKETLVGTVSGMGTSHLTITLNSAASDANVDTILQSVKANFATTTLGAHTVTATITSGDQLETLSKESTYTLVGDFVVATANGVAAAGATAAAPITLAAILGATLTNKVVLNGNTYVSVTDADYATGDIDALIDSGALTVADGAVIRIVSAAAAAAADLTGVTGLNSLGTIAFGSATQPLTANLKITAAQANGLTGLTSVSPPNTITISGVEDTLNADLSGFAGQIQAQAVLAKAETFTGVLGVAELTVLNNDGADFALTIAADKADGHWIVNEGSDRTADIIVTGVDAGFKGDLSGLNTNAGGVVINFADSMTLNAEANLATNDLEAYVANNKTLTLSTTQASAISDAGGSVAGVGAVGTGNTGGSIVVSLADDSGALGTQVTNLDLTGLTAGNITDGAVQATRGSVTMNIAQDVNFVKYFNQGDANVTVAAGATVSADADVLSGAVLSGAGNVTLQMANGEFNVDLSDITVAGAKTVNVTGWNDVYGGDLGNFHVAVADDSTFQTSAAIATGLSITGAKAIAADETEGGSIYITGLDGKAAYDFSGVVAGAASATGANDAGTFTATVGGSGEVVLDAGTNLGTAALVLGDDYYDGNQFFYPQLLTLAATAAQLDGRSVVGDYWGNESVKVNLTGAVSTLDLSGITTDIDSVTGTTSTSINLSAMKLGALQSITAQDGDAATVSTIKVTMTALQADHINSITESAVLTVGDVSNGVLANDVVGLTVTASVITDANGVAKTTGSGVAYIGSTGADTLAGTQLDDIIFGGAGNDVINAGNGDNVIVGGAGRDNMTGGDGVDTFVFVAGESGIGAANRDIINGFTDFGVEGGDVIDLSGLFNISNVTFKGTAAFNTALSQDQIDQIGQIRYTVTGGNAIVEIDYTGVNGTGAADGKADMQITLVGVDVLTGSDFSYAPVITP